MSRFANKPTPFAQDRSDTFASPWLSATKSLNLVALRLGIHRRRAAERLRAGVAASRQKSDGAIREERSSGLNTGGDALSRASSARESRPRGRACPPPASRRTDPGQRQCRTRWPGRCRSEPRQPNPAPSTPGPSRQSADSHQAGASIAGRRRISPRTVRLPSVSPLAVDPRPRQPASGRDRIGPDFSERAPRPPRAAAAFIIYARAR